MEDNSGVTPRILNITLEIIYLLTGEDYLIVKKRCGRTLHPDWLQVVEGSFRKYTFESPAPSQAPEGIIKDKMLQLANQMMELLTGEVLIRCEDVAVYLSKEEREYLEGHKELYKTAMMDDLQLLPSSPAMSHDMCVESEDRSAAAEDDMMEDELTIVPEDGPVARDHDFTTQDQQTLQHAGEGRRTPGEEGCLATVTPEDGMTTSDSLGPLYSECKGDMQESLVIRIKEEPLSDEEDHVTMQQIPYKPLHIKEELEPPEVMLPSDDTMPQTFSKMGTMPAGVDRHLCANMYSPGVDHGKEEPILCGPGSLGTSTDIYGPTSHITHPAPNMAPETLAYEIPVSNVPNRVSNNASVYSVRQRKDTMEILYHCPSCNKGFSSNLDLARHQVIHTVDKLFICSLCGKSFTELSFLVKHQVIHTDLKRCVCPVCGDCFYSETSLAKHQKTHSLPAFCSICSKCFFDKSELAIHERKHTGERPFGCHICGKHFIAKGVLNKHMLTHTHISPSN